MCFFLKLPSFSHLSEAKLEYLFLLYILALIAHLEPCLQVTGGPTPHFHFFHLNNLKLASVPLSSPNTSRRFSKSDSYREKDNAGGQVHIHILSEDHQSNLNHSISICQVDNQGATEISIDLLIHSLTCSSFYSHNMYACSMPWATTALLGEESTHFRITASSIFEAGENIYFYMNINAIET